MAKLRSKKDRAFLDWVRDCALKLLVCRTMSRAWDNAGKEMSRRGEMLVLYVSGNCLGGKSGGGGRF